MKDFLYAYNYIDRWYDFEIGGINLRDVVIFDNSILPGAKAPRGLANEIVKISSKEGRQGNSTQSFYVNRISSYTGHQKHKCICRILYGSICRIFGCE